MTLAAVGDSVAYHTYPGGTRSSVLVIAASDATGFIKKHFAHWPRSRCHGPERVDALALCCAQRGGASRAADGVAMIRRSSHVPEARTAGSSPQRNLLRPATRSAVCTGNG